MPIFALSFVAGAWALQQLPGLPTLSWAWGLLPLFFLSWRLRHLDVINHLLLGLLGAALGFSWAAWLAHSRMADELPHAWEGRDIQIIGVVASLPAAHDRGERFDFDVEQVQTPGAVVPKRISLMHYRGGFAMGAPSSPARDASLPIFHAGERWQLTVRLKRPHSTSNPHGYDFELWMLERNIRASGYIRNNPSPVRLDAQVNRPGYWVEMVREAVSQRMAHVLQDKPYAGVLKALAIGEDDAISQQDWQVFRRTGIIHLVSISGLHITMLSGIVYALVVGIWRRIPGWVLYLPARKVGLLAGVLTAVAYSLVAGFSVPTQRTLYMLSVFALAFWSGRRVSIGRVLLLALLIVVMIDPWAVLAAGFWLSFGAVALIAYVMGGRLQRPHWLRDAILTQWAVTVGLMPALLLLFGQFSLISPFANAFAIPLVSLVIVPLTLLGSFLPLDSLLWLAHWIMQFAMDILVWLSNLPSAVWQQHAPSVLAMLLAAVGVACLLLPRGIPLRWLGLVGLLPLFLEVPPAPANGDMRVAVLDVGQGLAVVVRTETHVLVYDTGPKFSSESDSGSRVIVPYLHGEGVKRLHGVVVSHDDLDHTGGLDSVLSAIPVDWLLSSLPADKPELANLQHLPCQAGQQWHWDGIDFDMLYPANAATFPAGVKTNNRSCVLRVRSAGGTLLLPGDIERSAEADLLDATSQNIATDVLVAPHHGSKTSSTLSFVEAAKPQAVIFTVGYRNRFRHPRQEVLAQYDAIGAKRYRSDHDGAVILDFKRDSGIAATRWREKSRRYWYDMPAGFTPASLAETGGAR
ncbi:DNA internalization-related competence protein ComEC/Rec2 [Methylobacillus arboreus]|uniref:DNA internalization-related competence protein ComEC/Rec2 n=1 Tax=Methylobacillus arboreus TaxID=755170 RepID=UPI001E43F51B|nr:DNA internalization-related competence protein ComEC/Rec2 [Methylobacillus arboreus]MCB5190302.1 DNA internalization-related competence protein ComEC/Rec2 [Methylobacillus arboreus]